MKIIYLITGLGIGGAESITINLANWMYTNGEQVTLIYLGGENKQSAAILPGIHIINLNMRKTPFQFLNALLKAKKIVKEIQPDVVHAHMIHANIFARLLRLICYIPFLISTEHSKNIGSGLRMWLYRITDGLSDLDTNVSFEATDYFIVRKAFNLRKTITMYNGIDLNRFKRNILIHHSLRQMYQIEENEFVFLNVGRLVPAKDHKNLFDAFELLMKKGVVAKLLLVGDGELRKDLEREVEKKNLSGKVIFAGMHKNTEDYYNAANCFVLSSAWEGFGLVLGEAMACELPVISTNAGGCAEVVNNPEYVVPVRDPQTLSKAMEGIYRMSMASRRLLGKQNRDSVQRFGLEKICRHWREIYTRQYII